MEKKSAINLIRVFVLSTLLSLAFSLPPACGKGEAASDKTDQASPFEVPILLYHRFGSVVADNMTVRTAVFESHLIYLRDHGYTVVPLRHLVDYLLGKGQAPPPKSAVIVADDGHKSVFVEMYPLILKYKVPVTLFVYPSAISNAPYAMTWEELRKMKSSGLVDFQSHSYWHPNFRKDKRRMSHAEYAGFIEMQFGKSREKIEKELGAKVDLLAWPFGIYDEELIKKAKEAGYRAAFTIERRHAVAQDDVMTLPRYLMADIDRGKRFERLLSWSAPKNRYSADVKGR